MGQLAESHIVWLKNKFILNFIKRYPVNLKEAIEEQPTAYNSFNDFFIRRLKPELRPISAGEQDIISPVDGTIAQFGCIKKGQLLQAKQAYFDLTKLLGGDEADATFFYDGDYATFYLAPHNYHRVHMPIDGKLLKTIYIPGRFFSVNHQTTQHVPQLYVKNERLITLFDTQAGRMAVILVGAMIVGYIQLAWMQSPRIRRRVSQEIQESIVLKKGEELGYFKLGSTVILLFENNKICWNQQLETAQMINMGQYIGTIN